MCVSVRDLGEVQVCARVRLWIKPGSAALGRDHTGGSSRIVTRDQLADHLALPSVLSRRCDAQGKPTADAPYSMAGTNHPSCEPLVAVRPIVANVIPRIDNVIPVSRIAGPSPFRQREKARSTADSNIGQLARPRGYGHALARVDGALRCEVLGCPRSSG